ncbi:hypothetical protein [[Mycobacterium] nativiensis]|uniref:Uncharacterized protein n=1 Tax=[Mycobacterium] nativiensis TaxID=2855503 RepID=A0ABU5Y3J7_9MYCO|nr:hypothetical protein [Mycolicibacter sp. MYC340]MEB3034780.1 hypothetical protein [Mycolicibacter sp. MYC340]
MPTTPPGGPPECEMPAPAQEPAPATNTTSCSELSAKKRRRAASRRLAILDSGRADPWHYDELPITEHQADAWQRTVAHLTAAGFRPIIPAEVLEGLR